MRKSKVRVMAAVLTYSMLLGGCGEAPYELTEKEGSVIANYSAHMVSKYNRYQKEGLIYVDREEETEEEAVETAGSENTEAIAPVPKEDETDITDGTDVTDGTEDTEALEEEDVLADAVQVSFSEQFGASGIEITYAGATLEDSYVEDDFYAMYPEAGNVYLVLVIDLKNTGSAAATVDHLTKQPEFHAVLNGSITTQAERTILLNDFSTLEGEIAAGETMRTVLLFPVPADTGNVQSVELYAVMQESSYQIIL